MNSYYQQILSALPLPKYSQSILNLDIYQSNIGSNHLIFFNTTGCISKVNNACIYKDYSNFFEISPFTESIRYETINIAIDRYSYYPSVEVKIHNEIKYYDFEISKIAINEYICLINDTTIDNLWRKKYQQLANNAEINKNLLENKAIETSIEHKKLLQKIEKLEDELLEKSNFFSFLTHEIRNPIHGIIGLCNLMATSHTLTREELAKKLHLITNSAKHINLLINDYLDLSKIDAGKLAINYTEIDVLADRKSVV